MLTSKGPISSLEGAAIPLLAQITGIVDVFDALTTDRPYRAALPFARAAEELRVEAALGWRRADLVATFLDQVGPQAQPNEPPVSSMSARARDTDPCKGSMTAD